MCETQFFKVSNFTSFKWDFGSSTAKAPATDINPDEFRNTQKGQNEPLRMGQNNTSPQEREIAARHPGTLPLVVL